MTTQSKYDVIIVGGSYAGLSAAMALGRSLRKVLIIDNGKPCNRYTPHSHNFITHDGVVPAIIAGKAKVEVQQYESISFFEGLAVSAKKTSLGFVVSIDSGKTFFADKLILATGVRDLFPTINGFTECWGKTVIHCPYCHGYEFKSEKTAIMANGERAYHLAPLVKNLTKDVSIITSGKSTLDDVQKEKLAKHYVETIEKEIVELVHDEGNIKTIIFSDGSEEDFSAMYAAIPFEQHSDIPFLLGCEFTESGHIKIDMFQKTTIEGVFACGDNSTMMRSVASAVATGNLAGAMVNKELIDERF